MATNGLELEAAALRAQYADDQIPLSTADIDPLETVAGQMRALDAIAFGLDMAVDGYNIATSGPRGSGRNMAVRLLVNERALSRSPADDWVYLHNFADPYRPRAVRLNPAQGDELQREMAALVHTIENDLPAVFESEEYQERSAELLAPMNARREEALAGLNRSAQEAGFAVNATAAGFAPIPLGQDGQPLGPEVFRQLPDAARHEFEQRGEQVQEAILSTVRELRNIDKDARSAIQALDAEVGGFAIQHQLDELRAAFPGPDLLAYIDAVEQDVIANLKLLRRQPSETTPVQPSGGPPSGPPPDPRDRVLRRYEVNLFVTHGEDLPDRAPVVEESQPTYYNLFGRLDYETQFGTVTTDFTQIRPGALHLANGGYLLLQAEDVMADPRSWLKLKRSLKTKQVRVEDSSDIGLPLPTLHLVPQPIPLDVKVVLIGAPMTIGLLDAVDPDFAALFKIRAEFEPDTPVLPETIAAYTGFVCREADLCSHHFDRSAMREVLRFGNRLATRQDRLSTQFSAIGDLCQEAHQLAHNADDDMVTGEHVRFAVQAMNHRADLVPTRMRRMIAEGSLHIETSGEVVGQVNGLAVYSIGRESFGTPTRITCRVGAGTLGVVNIERETERSGAIHTKGVLVLSGFLMGTFGRAEPLSFSGSVTFEQSYDEVDGDSASSAELYSILTALAGVPMRQDLAVTGSVDQFGNIQPVGGVTQKVEGFFDVCREIGLTGTQGVIIPRSNVINLTLRDEVVTAVEEGRFHVWAISRIEQGLELLTGVAAGDVNATNTGEAGAFAEGTIFAKVAAALHGMRSAPAGAGPARFPVGDPQGEVDRAADPLRPS